MYHRIMRRLLSHPSCALEYIHKFTSGRPKVCPFCHYHRTPERHHTDQRNIITYRCTRCNKTFSELIGTIFYRSKVPLHKWLLLIIFWVTGTGGISAADAARKLGVSHATAWKMLTKIRIELSKDIATDMLAGEIESDESWFGHKENQEIVLGLVQRGRRKLRLMVIPNVKEATLYPLIKEHVQYGSNFWTDSLVSYAITGIRYHHQTVNHSHSEFARDNVHTNTIEQIWGSIKGIIRTIHHGVSRKYRKYYLAQYVFRYENENWSNLFNLTLFKIFSPTYCLI